MAEETPSKQRKNMVGLQNIPAQDKTLYRFECEEEVKQLPDDIKATQKGIAGMFSCEAIPTLVPMDVDTLIPVQPRTNAQIVFTKDRPGSRFSGTGGAADTRAAAIDIVVGRMGAKASGKDQLVDPNFTHDAARIYISQKSDVDTNFKLKDGGVGNAKGRSAIALKADGIRIIAREGIKLVSGTDEGNSQGGDIKSIYGIDIIAGNQDGELEPVVKGKRIVACLDKLADIMAEVNAAVKHGFLVQSEFNLAIQNHFHYSPWYGNPALPSDACQAKGATTSMEHLQQTQRSLTSNRQNIAAWKQNNLCESGRDFVLSRWNRSN
jgi:hypothetical protein